MKIERTYLICKKCGKKIPFETREDESVVWTLKDYEMSAFFKEHKHSMYFDFETAEVDHDN